MTTPFEPYAASHQAVLLLLAAAALAAWTCGRRLRQSRLEERVRRLTCAAAAAVIIPLELATLTPSTWDINYSLPIQLCDFAWMAALVALWSRRQWAYGLLYFWGLTLTSQALFTPHLEFDFPHLHFFIFWVEHGFIVVAAIFLTWGLGMRPGWSCWRRTCTATLAWEAAVLTFNFFAGTNYGFLSHKPETASALDYLGPWPVYLGVGTTLVFGLWALMTWPWVPRKNLAKPAAPAAT